MKKLFFLTLLALISINLLGINRPNNKPTNNSISHLIKKHQLPYRGGKMRYIPPKNCSLNQGLPTSQSNGFIDKFDNVWEKGRGITANEEFEWDVQLANKNKKRMKRLAAPDGNHVNVSLTGRVSHYKK